MHIKISYREKYTIEERKFESSRVKIKYPDRIPVILTKDNSSLLKDISKQKYLVPYDYTIGQFLTLIRKQILIEQEQAINLFVIDYNYNQILAATSVTMESLYNQYVSNLISNENYDGYLYIVYTGENVFGSIKTITKEN
jgi:GABA(A) receptor-associated protein